MNVLCTGKALIRNLKCLHQLRLHSSEIPFPTCFGIMLQAPKNIKKKKKKTKGLHPSINRSLNILGSAILSSLSVP